MNKRTPSLGIVLLLAAALPVLAAAESPRAPELPADWKAALKELPAAPSVTTLRPVASVPRQEIRVYQRGDYNWEDNARAAMETAEGNFRAADFSVLASQVLRQGSRYGFRIEYYGSDLRFPAAALETYRSQPGYNWDDEAAKDMNRTEANLRQAGFQVILGQVLRSGSGYLYEIDYVRSSGQAWPQPGQQTRTYQRGGYAWDDNARAAIETAEGGFRAAGFSVLAGQVLRQGSNYGFRLEYLSPGNDPRFQWADLETYRSQPGYNWDDEAAKDMAKTQENLRQQGFAVILGQVLRSGSRYLYEIDYLRPGYNRPPQPWPRPELQQTGGPYKRQHEAERDMYIALGLLKVQGHEIVSSSVYEERHSHQYYFRILYRERRR